MGISLRSGRIAAALLAGWCWSALPASAQDATGLPADRVLVAAAALTGADLTVLPAAMTHGGGASALLRWDDA